MHRYILVFRTRRPLAALEIGRFIGNLRHRALECGVTGMVTGGGGIYYQAMEGPKPELDDILAQLRSDIGAAAVTVLSSRAAGTRAFDRLNMVYADPAYLAPALRSCLAALKGAGSKARVAQQAAEAFVATHARAAA